MDTSFPQKYVSDIAEFTEFFEKANLSKSELPDTLSSLRCLRVPNRSEWNINSNSVMTLVGIALFILRKDRGYSVNKLATKVKIHPVHITRIEQGKIAPRWEMLTRISKALEVSVTDLIQFANDIGEELGKKGVAQMRKFREHSSKEAKKLGNRRSNSNA